MWHCINKSLKVNLPHNYPDTPTDYRHTDKHLRLLMTPIGLPATKARQISLALWPKIKVKQFSWESTYKHPKNGQTAERYQIYYLHTSQLIIICLSNVYNGSDWIRLVFAHPFPLNSGAPIASANFISDRKVHYTHQWWSLPNLWGLSYSRPSDGQNPVLFQSYPFKVGTDPKKPLVYSQY